MVGNRRSFIAGLIATGLIPKPTWADAASPTYLSAAARPDGAFVLCGINNNLDVTFEIPLPARGHAAAAHPTRPEAVAFARRPGTFAVVIDCITGATKAKLSAPSGRHFYGHGTFSKDGDWLYTTENDYEAGQGRIGVWDVRAGYTRAAEFTSGGTGPHDIKRLPDSEILVIANGGIETHPDTGRTKLNIPTMAPNLAYIDNGIVIEVAILGRDLHKNSIRHLAVSARGEVAFGMQWQGDQQPTGLVGIHQRNKPMRILETPRAQLRDLQGYIGSICFGVNNKTIAVTSPKGGVIQTYDSKSGVFKSDYPAIDVGGIAANQSVFITTSGTGRLQKLGHQRAQLATQHALRWDNHLITI